MKKLKSLRNMTEDQVQAMIAADPDAPEATDGQLAQARRFTDSHPALAARMKSGMVQRPAGRPRDPGKKVSVSLRLDPDVLEKFRSGGPGWQTRINEALRKA
ncbi:BrnA antitoxin family protein [Nguyenibacter sp. L1]|uniref:BrnA antitoxin family protein n=1 Tax=Nguyenibacter sp. L1 TaxID=3049350 RepID=UPI002B471E99|nr:BrnA antitoxin family protein [Nguyenibacter sp. L1]WRH87646.1 BrnA antitoxin family protein [Nguyenibacter sp. L1]